MNKILIIDDDKELCALIKQSVLQENIEADYCYSGKSGLLKLKEKEYQIPACHIGWSVWKRNIIIMDNPMYFLTVGC